MMWRRRETLLLSMLTACTSSENDALSKENAELKERLQVLENELQASDKKWGYVVVKGLIVDAENVYMETMDVHEAKQYCNAHPECKGFTFGGPDERPEDEVTVTFKAGSKVAHDVNWVSYVKESSSSGFGAIGDAAMQLGDAHSGSAIVYQSLTYEAVCVLLAMFLAAYFCRMRGGVRQKEISLLPRP